MEFLVVALAIAGCIVMAHLNHRLVELEEQLRRSNAAQATLKSEVEALRDQLMAPKEDRSPRPQPGAPTEDVRPEPAKSEPAPPAEPSRVSAVPPVPAATPPAAALAPASALEERLGTSWAVWVGGLALALGGLFLVGYMIEQGLFGPGVRVAMGATLAALLIGAGEWLRRSERKLKIEAVPAAHIPSLLTAVGTVIAFATTYAAHALYSFIGPALAFLLLGAIGVATMLASALHGPALAGLGLAGSYVAPLLVSSPSPNPWPVVVYLAAVAGAAYALARVRRWLWLAATAVAGAFAWGVVFAGHGGAAATDWTSAAMVHTIVQLALAAGAIALEPHLAVRDEEAAPDWIATGAMAALAILALIVLASDSSAHWLWHGFALVAIAMLAATGVISAPAAASAVWAGGIAIGALLLWSGLQPETPPRGFSHEIADVLRIPDNIYAYLTFAAVVPAAIAVAAGWRLMRGRLLPVPTAGLYGLAVTVPPLLGLVVAYLRVTQFDRSIPFALAGAVLAAILAFAADRFQRAEGATPTPSSRLATGAFAAAAIAALAFALTASLERGYLTVALALAAAGTAFVATLRDVPLLRYAVSALGLVVLGRIVWDPRIMGTGVGAMPIFNWLLVGYGVPAVAFSGAAMLLRFKGEDLAVRLCDGLAVLFAALLAFFEIRHLTHAGNPLAAGSGHIEQGLLALASFAFAYVLIRLDLARNNPVFHLASLAFGVFAALFAVVGLGLLENPLFNREAVEGPPGLSSLTLAYLLPGLAAALVARTARRVRPEWYVTGAGLLAVGLLFGYVTLEVRHLYQGSHIDLLRRTGGPEQWTYSVAWLALGLLFLGYGIWRGSREARRISAAMVVVTVLKVFLLDLAGLSGLWRAFSFISLGLVLIGIGFAYRNLVFAKPTSSGTTR